jgi:diguanylate cyclase (GGDEF)-like protein
MTDVSEGASAKRSTASERDALTGLPVRSAFVTRLTARAERALLESTPFGLCIVDFDHFKKINLSHGPTCGDAVLRDVAQRLVRTITAVLPDGAEPLVGRYDGNAFAVLVESQSPQELAAAAEALRHAVMTTAPPTGSRITASVGAVQTRIGEGTDALLVRAEQALYLAKQFGRDRVEIGRTPTPLRADGTVLSLRRSA